MEKLLENFHSFRKSQKLAHVSNKSPLTGSAAGRGKFYRGHSLRTRNTTRIASGSSYNPKSMYVSHSANLDGLPVDVKIMIIEAIDNLTDLRALLHSSPSYLFLEHRALWLWLRGKLIGNLFHEAHSLVDARKSSLLPWFLPEEDAAIALFRKHNYLPKYHPNRLDENSAPAAVNLETLNQMAIRHQWVEAATSKYINTARSQTFPVFGRPGELESEAVTNRIYRTFYLLELICVAFPKKGLWGEGGRPSTLREEDLPEPRTQFFDYFPVPMKGQVNAIFEFLKREYSTILNNWRSFEKSRQPRKFRFWKMKFEQDMTIIPEKREAKVWQCTSAGLRLFYGVLCAKDIATQIDIMEDASCEVASRLPRYRQELLLCAARGQLEIRRESEGSSLADSKTETSIGRLVTISPEI